MSKRKPRTRRRLSHTQIASRDARRKSFDVLVQEIAAMSDADRHAMADQMAGAVTVEGHALSLHNACLIFRQRRYATIVGGFRQWLAHGRVVRKGEHGMMILAPRKGKTATGPDQQEEGAEDSQTGRLGFIPVTVFDIAQTEAVESRSDNGVTGEVTI